MAFFGVDTQVRVEEMLLKFKNYLKQKGLTALAQLRGIFKKADCSNSGKLDCKAFEQCLSEFG